MEPQDRRRKVLRHLVIGRMGGIWTLPLGVPLAILGWNNLGFGLSQMSPMLAGLGGDILAPLIDIGIFVAVGPAFFLAGLVLVAGAVDSIYVCLRSIADMGEEVPKGEIVVDVAIIGTLAAVAVLAAVLSYLLMVAYLYI